MLLIFFLGIPCPNNLFFPISLKDNNGSIKGFPGAKVCTFVSNYNVLKTKP